MRKKIIQADHGYLLLPISNTGGWFVPEDQMQYLGIYLDGRLMEEYEVSLSRQPRAWSALDLTAYAGKRLEIRLEGGDEELIDRLVWSDRPEEDTPAEAKSRPFVHMTPRRGFMNDPNGLFYYEGQYHCFAQLNPYGFGVGNTHWMHTVSTDLMHWQQLPHALLPDESGRMYSGGGVVDWNNTSGQALAGGKPPIALFYTAAGSKSRWSQGRYFEIAVAFSNDGGQTFHKYEKNPVVPNLSFMNRDPKVVWNPEEHCWIMAIFLDSDRYLLLYSDNLLDWQQGEIIPMRGAAECPDLFCLPLDGREEDRRWVLWGCPDSYIVGRFQNRKFIPETDTILGPSHQIYSAYSVNSRTNGGYAPQTFSDVPGGRVIQLEWLRTMTADAPFNSCMSIPNELRLIRTKDGPRLTCLPAEEIRQMTEDSFSFRNKGLEEIERIPMQYLGECMDITFGFVLTGGHLIGVSVRGVLIVYQPETGMLILPTGAFHIGNDFSKLDLRVVTDRCSVEIYANGGQFHTALCTRLDPMNILVKPVYLDACVGVDFEIHKLKSMYES